MQKRNVIDWVKRTRRIKGWMQPGAAYMFALLNEIQHLHNIHGNLFEIGAHHGKSAVVLGAMTDQRSEHLGVCDLFGAQADNISKSGRGDLGIFQANMREAFADITFVKVFQKRSDQLTIEDTTDHCRLFHVDGGHSTAEALGDLELAARALIPQGAIVVDDAFCAGWPGVNAAIFKFLDQHAQQFSPLLIGFNKMVLVPKAAHGLYATHLEDWRFYRQYLPREPYEIKRQELCGSRIWIYGIPTTKSEKSLQSRVARLRFTHPWLDRILPA